MEEPAAPRPRNNELTPKYSSYVRARLPKTEISLTYVDYLAALGAFKAGDESQSAIFAKKVVPRFVLFGHLPPSILPSLLQLTYSRGKKASRLQRLVDYLVQLVVGDGSAGTSLPHGVPSPRPLPKAVDSFALDSLQPVWAGVDGDTPFTRKAAALKALTAAAKAVLTSRPDDSTLVRALMEALYGILEQTNASGGFRKAKKRRRKADAASQAEALVLQRLAFWAARVALSASSLKKVTPLAFSGVSSQDPVGARHALALAAMLAQREPGRCAAQLEPSLQQNLDAFEATGSLTSVMLVRLPLQDGPLALNLQDPLARVYLARACGAILHSSYANGNVEGRGHLYWRILLILACCDQSEQVALEAVRGLLGATCIRPNSIRNAEAPRKLEARHRLDAEWEAENARRLSGGWKLLCRHGDEDAPVLPTLAEQPSAKGMRKSASSGLGADALGLAKAAAAGMRKSASTSAVPENPFAAPGAPNPFAAPAAGGEAVNPFAAPGADRPEAPAKKEKEKEELPPPPPPPPQAPTTVLEALAKRLLQWSVSGPALACAVCRTVAAMAEARAHAVQAHGFAGALGPMDLQHVMEQLQIRMVAITREHTTAHLRQLATTALVWFYLPNRPIPLPLPAILQTMTKGGTPLVASASSPFLAPWPEDCTSAFLLTLLRRLAACPDAAEYLLQAANATVAACPSRVNEEQLQLLWDAAVSADINVVSLAALRSVLELLHAHTAPITQPPSSAAPSVKAAAAAEEACLASFARLAAFWLGENANYATDEYIWANKPPPPPAFHPSADVSNQEKMAVAAAVQNPMLAAVISNLQRALLTCTWEVRAAAAAALAKIGVRSGEPYRIQCYSVLAGTRASGADPLGLAAVVEPALQVLDAMYAGEIVYDQLVLQHGGETSEWPDNVKAAVMLRHATLTRLASERIGFMPKDVFYPLGPRSRMLISGEPDTPLRNKKPSIPDPPVDSPTAAAAAAAAAGPALELTALDLDFLKNFRAEDDDDASVADSAATGAASPKAAGTGKKPAAAGASNPLSAILGANFSEFFGKGGDSSDDDDTTVVSAAGPGAPNPFGGAAGPFGGPAPGGLYGVPSGDSYEQETEAEEEGEEEVIRGEVQYDFIADNDEEVTVTKGEEVEVKYEMGGWVYVVTGGGYKGLVPSSYVKLPYDLDPSPAEAAPASPDTSPFSPPPISTEPRYSDSAYPQSPASAASSPPIRNTLSFSPSALAGAVSAGAAFGGVLTTAGGSGAWVQQRDAVVAFDFAAEGEGELSVKVGQQVTVAGEVDGWLQVVRTSDAQQGLVPASYVEYL